MTAMPVVIKLYAIHVDI